ncbi:NAD+ synthase [Gloeobacter kilaueensis]|uniref:Glutamine-dependent NAD(+) synthetase n=1 Tax=Gloeobacter kilaueensis (strain ATCC BAA-2537 / CCAP 1431/1 / ULC 316 / JS1) TaxID=1183438 RepID=U5QKU5_GLOK1|nr:NAD+ synthase [Gloeobacter kilaueensis]AGY59488.1 NAD+ synthetase [Gloeobacter kilaueensis JS1]
MQIALLQLNLTVGDLVGNAGRIEQAARQAAACGADLAVTSELALLGYPPRDLLLDPAFVARAAGVGADLARALRGVLPVLVGTVVPSDGGRPLANAAVLLAGGECRVAARKVLLPTYDVFDEDRYFEPGKTVQPLDLARQSLGVHICEDGWNDREFWPVQRYHRDPVEELVTAGAGLLINLSASPYYRGVQSFRERLLGHTARRHRLPLLYVNQVGGNDELLFDGCSCAFGPDGGLVARARSFEPDLLVVDTEALSGHCSPVFAGEAEVWEALVMGTADYVRKCGFRQALVAFSGGIDSALTLAVASAALGPANVLAVLMPSPYSSPGSIDDSLALAANLGVETLKLPIAPAMDAFEQILSHSFAGYSADITEENLQARIRGTLMMALSNKFGRLVLTTGNKSETAVGYNTLYGDTAGALAVISDLYKGEVYRLAHWLNRDRELIPASILTKPPSAELRPGQRDSDSLPPYDALDSILRLLIEQNRTPEQIEAAGHDPATVRRVLQLVDRAEFKRRQLPPGLRVSPRAFGIGWRQPIAAHKAI